ncbi:PQQ-binding-like beta-propeller repeat protein, partial [Lonsdalea quercina]
MQLRKTLLVGLVSTALLSGCSLFDREEDVVKMSPLPQVENQFTPTKVWSRSIGSGTGEFYSNLRPAWQDSRVYAAERRGTVKALDLSNGEEKWKADLSEKTGLLSANRPALLSGGVSIAGNHVYVGSERAKMFALNAE